jgi:hypothetical protein
VGRNVESGLRIWRDFWQGSGAHDEKSDELAFCMKRIPFCPAYIYGGMILQNDEFTNQTMFGRTRTSARRSDQGRESSGGEGGGEDCHTTRADPSVEGRDACS